jgi:hypothetical protein
MVEQQSPSGTCQQGRATSTAEALVACEEDGLPNKLGISYTSFACAVPNGAYGE